ncbi:MAG: glycyl-radical enzyme activating protein [Solidesulfovibrio sp.]
MSHGRNAQQGIVFNIQKYSVHDGPGIRTLVFLKGCTLACRWCSNPEALTPDPVLAYNPAKCIGIRECGHCLLSCTAGALTQSEDGKIVINRELCTDCMFCAKACPAQALTTYGRTMSVTEVLATVEADAMFYSRSGGGMTLSGGEPLMQHAFATALLAEARRRRINTAMETAGNVPLAWLTEACRHLNHLLYDIKSLDSDKHKAATSAPNSQILENLRQVRQLFPKLAITARTPVVPGFNDTEKDIRAIAAFVRTLPDVGHELLQYHRLAKPKYEYIDRDFTMGDATLGDAAFRLLRDAALEVVTG